MAGMLRLFMLLSVLLKTCAYEPKEILHLEQSGFGRPSTMAEGLSSAEIPSGAGNLLSHVLDCSTTAMSIARGMYS